MHNREMTFVTICGAFAEGICGGCLLKMAPPTEKPNGLAYMKSSMYKVYNITCEKDITSAIMCKISS